MAQPFNNQKMKIEMFYGLMFHLDRRKGTMKTATGILKRKANADNSSRQDLKTLCKQGRLKEALHNLHAMDRRVDTSTYVSLLQVCIKKKALLEGKLIHTHMNEKGLMPEGKLVHRFLWNTLVNMYAKCGSIVDARSVFDQMTERNVFSWTVMIAAYSRHGPAEEALILFYQMQRTGVQPDQFTFASVLPACANLGALEQGTEIHDEIIKNGFQFDVFVENALIDMYAKCGTIDKARDVFDKMPVRDCVSWNTMIGGYAMHGCGKEALRLFERMEHSGTKPDHVTLVCVLYACCHSGLVAEGWQYFSCMSDNYHITPAVEHYGCMVDLLCRAGRLDEAEDFINRMPIKPDATVWRCLLGSCRTHNNIELGQCVAERLFELEPENDANYVLLSNIYSAAGKWDDYENIRRMMKERRVKKTPGCSWIEVNKQVHAFIGGDMSHPLMQSICERLERLSSQMKAAGYAPDTRYVLNDVEEEQKEQILCHHSEKLAIAFGLINTPPGKIIRVIKNLRVCGDCHSALFLWRLLVMQSEKSHLTQVCMIASLRISSGWRSNVCFGTGSMCEMITFASVMKQRYIVNKHPTQSVHPGQCSSSMCQLGSSGTKYIQVVEALKFFWQMQLAGVKPNPKSFASVFPARANWAALEQGMEIHEGIILSAFQFDVFLGIGLVDACKISLCTQWHVDENPKFFQEMPEQNLVSKSVMIAGYAHYKPRCEVRLKYIFASVFLRCANLAAPKQDMEIPEGIIRCYFKSDFFCGECLIRELWQGVPSFSNSCSTWHGSRSCHLSLCFAWQHHVGLVAKGWQYFVRVRLYWHITVVMDQYGCMVGINGCVGQLDEAKEFFNKLPIEPDALCGEHIFELDTHNATLYVVLLKIDIAAGRQLFSLSRTLAFGDCHSVAKFISTMVAQKLVVRDANIIYILLVDASIILYDSYGSTSFEIVEPALYLAF
eukprot:Gb_33133 [translate_table: standard]